MNSCDADKVSQFRARRDQRGAWRHEQLRKRALGGAMPIVYKHMRAGAHQLAGGKQRLHATGRRVAVRLGRVHHNRTPRRVSNVRCERHRERRTELGGAKRAQLLPVALLGAIRDRFEANIGGCRLQTTLTGACVSGVIENGRVPVCIGANPERRVGSTSEEQHVGTVALRHDVQCNSGIVHCHEAGIGRQGDAPIAQHRVETSLASAQSRSSQIELNPIGDVI